MTRLKNLAQSQSFTSDLLRLKQIEKIHLTIDKARDGLISRELVRAEWTTRIRKLFEILEQSLERGWCFVEARGDP